MKKLILILTIFQLTVCLCSSQWIQQDSLVNYPYFNVKFLNKNTGWISGHNGTIVKTTNGGSSWVIQKNIPGKLMYGLHIVDSNIVYAAGWFETLLKTTNGGTNWIELQNGPPGQGHSYEAVFFINKETGWVTGTGNRILKTTNGGISFDSSYAPARCYDIYFRNSLEGLACGQSGAMFKTTNGGNSWYKIIVPLGFQAADFYRLTFVNQDIGYTQGVHNRKIYRTFDFGSTWDSVTRITDASYMRCLFFVNYNTGWSCGENNQIFKSINAGLTWVRLNTAQFNPWGYGALYFINDSIGWAVGTAGKIVYTTTGGLTFANEYHSSIPDNFKLEQNYPNPFNPSTNIKFEMPKSGNAELKVFDAGGREVSVLLNKNLSAGSYEYTFDSAGLPSGIYFYTLRMGEFVASRKMLLVK